MSSLFEEIKLRGIVAYYKNNFLKEKGISTKGLMENLRMFNNIDDLL